MVVCNFSFVCFNVTHFFVNEIIFLNSNICVFGLYEKLAMAYHFRQFLIVARQWPSQSMAMVQQFKNEKLKNLKNGFLILKNDEIILPKINMLILANFFFFIFLTCIHKGMEREDSN